MANRNHSNLSALRLGALVLGCAVAATSAASAKVDVLLRPRVSLLGGYDDNVTLNAQGGDQFGRASPGFRLDVFGDHQLHASLDCEVGLGRVVHPGRFNFTNGLATNEICGADFRNRLSTRTGLHLSNTTQYIQDPFAVSGLGLLLRPEQTNVFRDKLFGEVDLDTSPRGQWQLSAAGEVLAFRRNDPGNGMLLTPELRYALRTSTRDTWDFGGREQLFYGFAVDPAADRVGRTAGFLGYGHSALVGYTRRLAETVTLTLRGGGAAVTGTGRPHADFLPVARAELETYSPSNGLHFVASHDLVMGASSAGPLIGDLAEFAGFQNLAMFTAHARIGVYRNDRVGKPLFEAGSVGYGADAGLDWHVTRSWSLGFAALRDARITERNQGAQVDRNVYQVRLSWEKARFE